MQGALIAALLLAPPAGDPFCDGLRQIVAAVPEDFKALESSDPSLGTVGIGFPARGAQQGCGITPPTTYDERGNAGRVYVCQGAYYCPVKGPRGEPPMAFCDPDFYPEGGEPDDGQLREMAIRAAKCFNVPMYRDHWRWSDRFQRTSAYLVVVPGARIHLGYDANFGNEGPIERLPGVPTNRRDLPQPVGYALTLQVSRAFPD